jgi:hypothetical protein
MKRRTTIWCAAFAALVFQALRLSAHGFVGDRFFPPTISTDDPFATDELLLPSFSSIETPASNGSPQAMQLDTGFEFDKEIFPYFSLGVADDYLSQNPSTGKTVTGWDNLSLNAKYELWHDPKHEAIFSVGLDTDIGGTGDSNVGADDFTTFTPTLFFGKGLGDIPDDLWPMKPFAFTGTLGQSIPTSSSASNALEIGAAIEYSLPYLQQNVKDIGLPSPIRDLIPLTELTMEIPENRGDRGQVTGTVDPGILWETPYLQLGAEAVIPINTRTGGRIGGIFTAEIFIDDIWPNVFGHPLFGGSR